MFAGDRDVIAAKLDPTGSFLIYSTFIGGSGDDEGSAIAVDPFGNAIITGFTTSPNFPTTPGALRTVIFGGEPGCLRCKAEC
ncbi:SBBP repeat-containing protein [Paenibacillus sp. MSJ-34]|uniref:SBBP repeat-containing protein n=1 Tax=Paenibacillus sp. MSJ-34 TaxID=2841529 RepID=UPI001C115926|nr:SBBP repeat-containing protein [Paenibacillus sp. MSJ-34]